MHDKTRKHLVVLVLSADLDLRAGAAELGRRHVRVDCLLEELNARIEMAKKLYASSEVAKTAKLSLPGIGGGVSVSVTDRHRIRL